MKKNNNDRHLSALLSLPKITLDKKDTAVDNHSRMNKRRTLKVTEYYNIASGEWMKVMGKGKR